MEDSPCSEHSTTTREDDDGSRPAVWLLEKDRKAKRGERNSTAVRAIACARRPAVVIRRSEQVPDDRLREPEVRSSNAV